MVEEANHYNSIAVPLYTIVEILGPLTNFSACFILAMVVLMVLKMSKQVKVGGQTILARNKVSVLITMSHVGVTLTYTIT